MKAKKNQITKKLELIVRKNLKIGNSNSLNKILKLKVDDDIDSLSLISLVAEINQKLKVKFSAEQISKLKSLNDIFIVVLKFYKNK